MALIESQLDSMRQMREEQEDDSGEGSAAAPPAPTGYGIDGVPGALPLNVDYRSPISHFIPPAVELYAAKVQKAEIVSTGSSESSTPVKRKRGRPRIDKTSPEYLAKSAARKEAKDRASALNSSSEGGEKRKRGRPRIDKTSPEYLARKRAKELEALEKKAKRQYKRRATGDSEASYSGDTTPRVKRKYTKRPGSQGPGRPRKDGGNGSQERVKGKRGRPRKTDLIAAGLLSPGGTTKRSPQEGKIRVRSNLMPINSEPISLDSDDEPDLGTPSQDSMSLDENLRALRHIHEKYANLERDDALGTSLMGANSRGHKDHIRKQDLEPRVEKLEDSSNSDSSSSSGSGSSSSSSSSSGSSSSSDSSSDSDSDSDTETKAQNGKVENNGVENNKTKENEDERSFGAWSYKTHSQSSSDESLSSRSGGAATPPALSESDNESPDKSYQCHICRKWYSTQVTLKIHRRGHQNRSGSGRSRARGSSNYSCDECRRSFSRREALLQHRAEVHRSSVVFRCAVCRRCFEDDAELATHEAGHTPNEKIGKCGECGAQFASFEQLRRHRAAVHPNSAHALQGDGGSLSCTVCGKQFSHAHSLQRHQHNHARQLYRCVVCKASFARADQLAQHLNSHLANYKRLKP